MSLPRPGPGLVLRYAFLWRREFEQGRDEAGKDRPCTVVLAAPVEKGGTRVYLLPITHTPPADLGAAVEIPIRVKQQLGLDDDRSWIVLDEVNDFLWPGHDLRTVPGSQPPRIDYGFLPPRFFNVVRDAFVALARERRIRLAPRS